LIDLKWQLELVGDGEGMDGLKEKALELGLDSRIEFSGQQLDVPERMDRADIYLLITNWEGFPRSIIEAMRAGIPVISSNVGGCNESVSDGKTGYLVPRGNSEALRERIRELILDQKLCDQMGIAGRACYESEFTFRKMYEKTVAVYREIILNL
jgi:glycosyltransferase involved in cell wall biosynthesis